MKSDFNQEILSKFGIGIQMLVTKSIETNLDCFKKVQKKDLKYFHLIERDDIYQKIDKMNQFWIFFV